MTIQYLNDKQVASRYSVSRATIWRWHLNRTFPQSVKINGSTRWKLSDLEAWETKQEGAA